MGLFKSREEKAELSFNKGADLISQGKFEDALSQLEKSMRNGNVSPDVTVLATLLRLSRYYTRRDNLSRAIDELSKYPDVMVKFGVHDVNSSRILEECKLKLELAKLLEMKANGICDEDLGKQLIECGKHYLMTYPDETLVMEFIFSKKKMTGRECALAPLALGYEVLSDTIKWKDPRKAAEYLQKASHYHSENNNDGKAAEDARLQDNYSINAHCWFCGKKVIGKGIHFVSMPAEITDAIGEQCESDTNGSYDDGATEIYVCRACFSALDNLGKHYFGMSKNYTDSVAAQLQAEINSLQAQIASVRYR